MRKLLLMVAAAALSLAAQDGFTEGSAMGFDPDGRFNVGMESQAPDIPPLHGAFVADRNQIVTDGHGNLVFPKAISFSGSVSLRPRLPNFGWFGTRYVFHEDSLISLTLESIAGQIYVLFSAILKANSESSMLYVPEHVLPTLGSLPSFPAGVPLHLHLNIGQAGRGGSNTEIRFNGRWQ